MLPFVYKGETICTKEPRKKWYLCIYAHLYAYRKGIGKETLTFTQASKNIVYLKKRNSVASSSQGMRALSISVGTHLFFFFGSLGIA